MQPVQDLTVEDRVSRTQFQYTLEDPSADELNAFAPKMVERLKELPELRDVASDQQVKGLRVRWFSIATRLRAWASRPPPSTIRSTMPTASARCPPCSRS